MQRDRDGLWWAVLYGLIVRKRHNLQFCHSRSSPVGLKYEVTIDYHANRKSRADREGRLDIEVPSNDLLARLVDRIGSPETESLKNSRVVAVIGTRAEL